MSPWYNDSWYDSLVSGKGELSFDDRFVLTMYRRISGEEYSCPSSEDEVYWTHKKAQCLMFLMSSFAQISFKEGFMWDYFYGPESFGLTLYLRELDEKEDLIRDFYRKRLYVREEKDMLSYGGKRYLKRASDLAKRIKRVKRAIERPGRKLTDLAAVVVSAAVVFLRVHNCIPGWMAYDHLAKNGRCIIEKFSLGREEFSTIWKIFYEKE